VRLNPVPVAPAILLLDDVAGTGEVVHDRKGTGVILMVVGAVGFVASAIVYGTSRRPVGRRQHTFDREAVDSQGRSTVVHEEVR
jgi:hypothetical protein